jgi:hypothetical protein
MEAALHFDEICSRYFRVRIREASKEVSPRVGCGDLSVHLSETDWPGYGRLGPDGCQGIKPTLPA